MNINYTDRTGPYSQLLCFIMEIEQKHQGTTSELTFFKIVNGFVLLFHYLLVAWFYSEQPIALQIIGPITFLCGLISLFIPNTLNNVNKVKYFSYILYLGVLVFIIF